MAGWLLCPLTAAARPLFSGTVPHRALHSHSSAMLFIAQANQKSQQDTQAKSKSKPKSGELVMPSGYDQGQKDSKKKKTCLRVCSEWGETCVYDINKGRQCRRTCKATSMECFNK